MPCKGICARYKTAGRYATGSKRCHQCNLFIRLDGLLCPFRGYKLRTKPRHSKFKAKLIEQKVMEQAKKVKISYHSLPSSS